MKTNKNENGNSVDNVERGKHMLNDDILDLKQSKVQVQNHYKLQDLADYLKAKMNGEELQSLNMENVEMTLEEQSNETLHDPELRRFLRSECPELFDKGLKDRDSILFSQEGYVKEKLSRQVRRNNSRRIRKFNSSNVHFKLKSVSPVCTFKGIPVPNLSKGVIDETLMDDEFRYVPVVGAKFKHPNGLIKKFEDEYYCTVNRKTLFVESIYFDTNIPHKFLFHSGLNIDWSKANRSDFSEDVKFPKGKVRYIADLTDFNVSMGTVQELRERSVEYSVQHFIQGQFELKEFEKISQTYKESTDEHRKQVNLRCTLDAIFEKYIMDMPDERKVAYTSQGELVA